MAKKGRIHIPGAVYHVILRGNDHRDIFANDKDRYRFFSILDLAVQRFRFKIHAFCIMTTHFHLELQVADIPLSKIQRSTQDRRIESGSARPGRKNGFAKKDTKAISSPEIADPHAPPPIEHWLTPPQGFIKNIQFSKTPPQLPSPIPPSTRARQRSKPGRHRAGGAAAKIMNL